MHRCPAGKQEIEELELAMAEDVVIAEESGRFCIGEIFQLYL